MSKVTTKPYITPVQLRDANSNIVAISGDALKIDGSSVTQPVSAVSMPLPTDAAKESKQPALGTAGTASADVITVQGIASMTALVVDGSAVTQPISAASLPLPAGAATAANQASANADLSIIAGDTTSLDSKITSGSDASLSSAQQVIAYGKNASTFYPLPLTSGGASIAFQEDHAWTTASMFSAVTCADAATITSSTLDVGAASGSGSAGHAFVFYLSLSASITNWTLKLQSSLDGVTWYDDPQGNNILSSSVQDAAMTLENEFGNLFKGGRYYRFQFTNNDGGATSTDVTLDAGYYS